MSYQLRCTGCGVTGDAPELIDSSYFGRVLCSRCWRYAADTVSSVFTSALPLAGTQETLGAGEYMPEPMQFGYGGEL